jgi:hypothetical protein
VAIQDIGTIGAWTPSRLDKHIGNLFDQRNQIAKTSISTDAHFIHNSVTFTNGDDRSADTYLTRPSTGVLAINGVPIVTGSISSGVTSWNSRTGVVIPAGGDYAVGQVTGAAPLASPTFTGTPVAPTPLTADNSTSIATTAFVKAQGYLTSNAVSSVFGRTGAVTATTGDYTVAQITGAAPLASPNFTGLPTVPTRPPNDNSTDIASTAYVDAAVAAGGTGLGTLLAYDQATTFVNATLAGATLIAGTSHTYANAFADIEFFGTVFTPSVAGGTVTIALMDGATQVVVLAVIKTPAAANMEIPVYAMWRFSVPAGTHQYGIKITASSITGTPSVGGGTGALSTGFTPAFLRIRQSS